MRHPSRFAIFRPSCLVAVLALSALASGCSSTGPKPAATANATEITFPLTTAWYEDVVVQYISTDTSDMAMAKAKNMNFVPGLAAALGDGQAAPGQRALVERIYVFPDGSQANVLASMPKPVGYASTDKSYSPLWHLQAVAWVAGHTRRELRAEDDILEAADKGDVTVTPTRIVANCPVVFTAEGGLLPGTRLGYQPVAKP